jgi:hypothetical protein
MAIYPHDHRMWVVIGLYCGRESNTFYRPSPEGLVVAGSKELAIREAACWVRTWCMPSRTPSACSRVRSLRWRAA